MLVLGRLGGERISIVGEEWDQDILRLGDRAQCQGIRRLYFNSGPVTSKVELRRRGIVGLRVCSRTAPLL